MTSPIQPNVDPSAPPVASVAPGSAAMDEEIRQLAAALGVDQAAAMAGKKAVIDSISVGNASTPPTVQVNLGGVLIPDIRMAANYSPQVGDTVLLIRQGNEYLAAFKIPDQGSRVSNSLAGGWIKPTLAAGVSHAANGGGDVMYRRVNRDGCWAVEWQGCAGISGSVAILLDSGSLLPTDYRPTLRRTVPVARNITNNGVPTAYLDFNTQPGNATIVGGAWSIALGSSGANGGWSIDHSHGGSTGFTDPPGDGFANSHAHSIPLTTLGQGDHTHALGTAGPNFPDWISFDGVFYYL